MDSQASLRPVNPITLTCTHNTCSILMPLIIHPFITTTTITSTFNNHHMCNHLEDGTLLTLPTCILLAV